MDVSALIFDFDGTILDTETPIFEEWRAEYSRHGQELDVDFWGRSIGTHGVVDLAANLAKLLGDGHDPVRLRQGVRRRVRRRLAEQALRPGIESLLDDARDLGMPPVIASSSSLSWVEHWLEHNGIRQRFEHLRCRDHVARLKPAPDLFLSAAEALAAPPAACLVIEDSPNGVLAAKAASMRCVAVPNTVTRRLEMPPAELVVESLGGLSLEEILRRI